MAALEASGEGERGRRKEVEAALQVGRAPATASCLLTSMAWSAHRPRSKQGAPSPPAGHLPASLAHTTHLHPPHPPSSLRPSQEASSIFRRELADKNQQLDLLRQEVK